jgi:hypothetical protein
MMAINPASVCSPHTVFFPNDATQISPPPLTRPRNPISVCAVRMSGVFTVAVEQHLGSLLAAKIPDRRIELRSKRLPGTR